MSRWPYALVVLGLTFRAAAGAEVVLENLRFRAVLGEDAVWRSLVEKAGGRDLLAAGARVRFAAATVDGKPCEAASAALADGKLVVTFAGTDARLTYAVKSEADWVALRLESVAGARPSGLVLARLPVAVTKHVGPRLAAAYDDAAVCLAATGLQVQSAAHLRPDHALLEAVTQDAPGPHLEGAGVALVAAPTADLKAILRRLSVAFDLPRNEQDGVPSKELALARGSYWFLSFSEKDCDRVIDLCRRTGFRQVMLLSGAWCRTVGHYTFDTNRYPDGLESLRRTVGRLHAEGILVGMHCYASKISKTDAYVTPVPDRRFWVDRRATLAAGAAAGDAEVRAAEDLREWPGSPVASQTMWEGGVEKHREVLLDDEIVRYQAIGPDGKWDTFLGCERGAWGSRAAAHQAGTEARHYGVDGCINGYIIDQETTLLDEATGRLAALFNACGFDMVYFDGGEDVDRRRFTCYVSKFQDAAMRKFAKRPIVHMGTIMTHNLWHSFTRSGTVDTYLNTLNGHILAGGKVETWPTVRSHIDRSVQYMQSIGEDLMPGELGWFGIWPKGEHTDGLQLDETEYLMVRSLAHDAPVSLETGFGEMDRHPLTPGILEIVRAYETLRTEGKVDAATRERLRGAGKDFLLVTLRGKPEFVEAGPMDAVAGGRDVRAMVGAYEKGAVATVWHSGGKEGRLVLATHTIAFGGMSAYALGDPQPRLEKVPGGGQAVPVGGRRVLLVFTGLPPEAARGLLEKAAFAPRE